MWGKPTSDFRKAKSASRTLSPPRKRASLCGAITNQLAYGDRLEPSSHPSHERKKPPKGGFAKRLASDFRKAKSAKRALPSARKRRLLSGAFSNQLAYG
ncbi:MAG: hypothetical protein J6W28_07825, partial [Clostridia bacterium]|nr:hypothetical protein [Clostridia bacterium]